MHLFEMTIDVDASVLQCEKAWQECADAWFANEDFLNSMVNQEHQYSAKSPVTLSEIGFHWHFVATKDKYQRLVGWNGPFNICGTLVFDEVQHTPEPKTQLILALIYQDSMNVLDSFKLEVSANQTLQSALRQLRKIIYSNIENEMKQSLFSNPEPIPASCGLDMTVTPILMKEIHYATI